MDIDARQRVVKGIQLHVGRSMVQNAAKGHARPLPTTQGHAVLPQLRFNIVGQDLQIVRQTGTVDCAAHALRVVRKAKAHILLQGLVVHNRRLLCQCHLSGEK